MKQCKVKGCKITIASNRQYCEECKILVRRAKQRARSAKFFTKVRICIKEGCNNQLAKGKHKYCSVDCRPTKRQYYAEKKEIVSTKPFIKNHEDKLLALKLERDKKKYKGTVDPKWLTRGKISSNGKATTLEGSFTYD